MFSNILSPNSNSSKSNTFKQLLPSKDEKDKHQKARDFRLLRFQKESEFMDLIKPSFQPLSSDISNSDESSIIPQTISPNNREPRLTIDNNFLSPDSDDLKNSNLEKHEDNISQLFNSIVQSNQQPSQNPFQKKEELESLKEKLNKDNILQSDGFIKYDLKKSRFYFSPEKKNSVPDLDSDFKRLQENMNKRKSAIFYDPNSDLSERSPEDLLSNLKNFDLALKEKNPFFRISENKFNDKKEKETSSKNNINLEDYDYINNENLSIPNGSQMNSIRSIQDEKTKRNTFVHSSHELNFEEKIKINPENKDSPHNKLLSPNNIIPKKKDHKSFIYIPTDLDRSGKEKKETKSFSFINEDNPRKSSCIWKDKFLQLKNDLEDFGKKEEEFMKNLSASQDESSSVQNSIEEQKSNLKENVLITEQKNVDLQVNKGNSIRSFSNTEEIPLNRKEISNKSFKIDENSKKEKEILEAERKKEISPRILINNIIPVSEKIITSNVNVQSNTEQKRTESFFNSAPESLLSEIYRKTNISKENFKITDSDKINSKIHSRKPSKTNEELPISNVEEKKTGSFIILNTEQKSEDLNQKRKFSKEHSNIIHSNFELKNEFQPKEKTQREGSDSSLNYVDNLISEPQTDRNQINSNKNKKIILPQSTIQTSSLKKEDNFMSMKNFKNNTYVSEKEKSPIKINESQSREKKEKFQFEFNDNEVNSIRSNTEDTLARNFLLKENLGNIKSMIEMKLKSNCDINKPNSTSNNECLVDNKIVFESKNKDSNEFVTSDNLPQKNYQENLSFIQKEESKDSCLKRNRDIKSEIFQRSKEDKLISYFSIQPMTQNDQAMKNKNLFDDFLTPNSNKPQKEKDRQAKSEKNNLEPYKNEAIPSINSKNSKEINSLNDSDKSLDKQKADEKNKSESNLKIDSSNPSNLNNSLLDNLKSENSNNFERIKDKLSLIPLSLKNYSSPETNNIVPLRSTKEIKGNKEEEKLNMDFLKKRWNEFLEKTEKKIITKDKPKNARKIDDSKNFLSQNLENNKGENVNPIKSFKTIGEKNALEDNLKNLKILEIERAQENDKIQIRSLSNLARERDANFSESTPFKIQTEILDIRSNENKDFFLEESMRSEKSSNKLRFENKENLSKIEPKNSNERMEEIKKEEIQNEFSPVTNQKTQEKLNEISKEININDKFKEFEGQLNDCHADEFQKMAIKYKNISAFKFIFRLGNLQNSLIKLEEERNLTILKKIFEYFYFKCQENKNNREVKLRTYITNKNFYKKGIIFKSFQKVCRAHKKWIRAVTKEFTNAKINKVFLGLKQYTYLKKCNKIADDHFKSVVFSKWKDFFIRKYEKNKSKMQKFLLYSILKTGLLKLRANAMKKKEQRRKIEKIRTKKDKKYLRKGLKALALNRKYKNKINFDDYGDYVPINICISSTLNGKQNEKITVSLAKPKIKKINN